MSDVLIIGIAGGSGSGKTTFATNLRERIGKENSDVLGQDSYYIDQSNRFDHDGGSVNFDHPNSLEFSLMATHLKELKKGQCVEIPIYDFATHKRLSKTNRLNPHKIIFVDGILIFSQPEVVDCLDYKIFIDCEEDLRFNRRLTRDVAERGRTPEGVRAQFYSQVKPMHDEFVGPSKEVACDIVNVDNFDRKLDEWCKKIKSLI